MDKEKSCIKKHDDVECSFRKRAFPEEFDYISEEYAVDDACIIEPEESGIDGYLRISSRGQILEVNDAYCHFSGYAREELLGMVLNDLDVSGCRDDLIGNLISIIKQSKGRFEVTHRTKDGRLLDMEVSATYVVSNDLFFIFILKDINGFNQADKFFLEKGDTYMSLFKHNKAVMLVINPENFEIIDANIAACNYYGWPREEITRKMIHDINTLSPENIRAEMQNAVDEKRNYFRFKHTLANGEIRDVEVYSSPVTVNSQNLLYSVIHDITERKSAEDELKTREMQLQTAQKIGHIGSWGIALNSGNVFASEEAFRIYGLNVMDITIDDIQQIPLPEYRPILDKSLKCLIREQIPYDVHFKIKRPNDGVIRDIHSFAEYCAKKNTVIGTIQDITERKMAEDALLHAKLVAEAANRTKDDFMATMSHELRTPLTSVIGFSDILLDKSFGMLDEKQIRYVTHISDAGKHLLKLINDVLDLSKVEAGKMELQYEIFLVSDAVNEVNTLVSPLAMEKNIRLNVEFDHQLEKINADKIKFKQILYNLASNAIKFTPRKGSVTINARCDANNVWVTVMDTGIGISKENVDKLFQPFSQLNSYATNEYAGTGLGLALVKKFVELHEGRIWVESTLGEGSKFSFLIPRGNR